MKMLVDISEWLGNRGHGGPDIFGDLFLGLAKISAAILVGLIAVGIVIEVVSLFI